jgi:type III pantothenate kinase
MRFRALSDYTSKLSHLEPLYTSSWIGKSTDEAMQIGVQHGILTELQGTIDALSTQFSNLKIVATGGDFPFFANDLKTPIFADPFLVLRGLYEILRYNH